MSTVLVYVADQDPSTTSSKGILNATRLLIREMARVAAPPGFRVVVLVAEGNHSLFAPSSPPAWMEVDALPGPARGGGLARLRCDHVEVLRAARRHGARVVHFPKGWIPWRKPGGLRYLATLHDAIPEYYDRHYPGWQPWLKRAYFRWNLRHSLRRSDRVLTDSEASRVDLQNLAPASARRLQVVYLGPGLDPAPPAAERSGLLVLGSRQPHKATRLTLALLAANPLGRAGEPVRVAGLAGWPAEWGTPPALPGLEWLGKISDEALAREYARTRALVLLSEIEGFGLPALEAVLSGAAVCYRDVSSVGEIMRGAPGGWDGRDEASFPAALDQALQAPSGDWAAVRTRMESECSWDGAAGRVLQAYRDLLV